MAHGHSVTTRLHELSIKDDPYQTCMENVIIHILSISGYRRASVAQLLRSTAFEIERAEFESQQGNKTIVH